MSKDYVIFYKMVYYLSVIVENIQSTQNLMKVQVIVVDGSYMNWRTVIIQEKRDRRAKMPRRHVGNDLMKTLILQNDEQNEDNKKSDVILTTYYTDSLV